MKKKILSLLLYFPIILTLQTNGQDEKNNKDLYLKQNVAIVDGLVRSINQSQYVKELLLVDFNKTEPLPDSLSFQGIGFADNGIGFDRIANDGIYTSLITFLHNDRIPYRSNVLKWSVNEYSIIDEQFSYINELNDYLSQYNYVDQNGQSKLKIVIKCTWVVCVCFVNGCWCDLCLPSPQPGSGTVCFTDLQCTITISWEW